MPRNAIAYDEDFYGWTMEQARLLRSGELAEIDAPNLAEEIEDMGRNNKREVESRLAVLIMHLLKWKIQAEFRSGSWSATVNEQRAQIEGLLTESPSLQHLSRSVRPALYRRARSAASRETGLAEKMFPAECPFTPEQILSEDFLPED